MANNRLLVTLEAKDKLTNTINGAKDAVKDMKNEMNKAGKAASSLDDYEKKFNTIITSSGAVEQKLKQLQRLASDMEFKGLSGTDLFTKVVSQAGAAKDAISDARTAISKFSDDNMKLTASIQGFSTLAAAGTTLAGVMGLVGAKSDEVAQAILKVQSALSILNGIQQIANNLNKDSALMQRIRQIQMEDAAAKQATESIGKLASERLRDANALKGVAGARAADATTTAGNTSTQAANTTSVIANTGENAVNTEKTTENTLAVDKNTQSKKANIGLTEGQIAAERMAIAVTQEDTAAKAENLKMQQTLDNAEHQHIISKEESAAIEQTWIDQLTIGNASLETRTAVLNKYGFTLDKNGIDIRKLTAEELQNIEVEQLSAEQSAAIVQMRTALSKAVQDNTIKTSKYIAVMKAYNAEVQKGNISDATRAAVLKSEGLMFDVTSGKISKMPNLFKRAAARADEFTRAIVGMKLATTVYVAVAAAAVYAIYKLAFAEDEYVKELNEEAEKLQEDINKQKNLTAEQTRAKVAVENLKRAQEELNAIREREKTYINTAASSFSNLMSKYRNLSEEYSRLKSNHEKTTWIKNNKSAFIELGFAVNGVSDAEKYFTNNTSNIIEGFKLRAKAAAAAALAMQQYQKAMQLEMESTSTGLRGATVTVDQANKLPEELRNKLLKNTHREVSATKMYQAQYGGGGSISDEILDSYTVPLDASDDFLKQLAAHGFVAKKRSAEAKKAWDEGNRYMDESFKKQQDAAKKLGTPTTPTSAQDKPTNTTNTPEKPKTNLEQMEAQLKKLQDERVNIDISAPNADAQIADINRRIKAKEKEIKDYKIKVGAEVDTTPVEGSLEWINAKISELETGLRKNKLPVGVSVEDAKRQIEQFKKQQEQEEVKLGLKVVPEIGSIAEMQKKISDINTQLQNKNLSLPMRMQLITTQQELQAQIAQVTQGNLTIPANIEPQMSTMKGDLFDLRQSRQNAQNAINQIVSDFEAGIIKSRGDAEKAINEINDKLEELGEKKIEVKIGAKGISKTVQGIESVASSAADAFSALAEASDTPELNVAGVIAGGIASVIQGYGTATAMAAQGLGPWGWIAFGLAATAQLVSMIAAIDQATAGAQGYAQGGIVTGASSHGDALGINVNAGEMVLTKQQQGKLWNTINDNRTEPNRYFDTPRIVGKIRGRDMVLMMQNESKMKNKAGLSLNIS